MVSGPVLVAYTTNSGSTGEVAKAVAEALEQSGCRAEVRRLEEVTSLEGFGAVIVGGPMILGWHRAARAFVARHRSAFREVPVAYFCTAMSLTKSGETAWGGVPVAVDPKLAKPPQDPSRLNFRERYALAESYLKPILGAGKDIRPASVAFFGGKLDLMNLGLLAKLFVMLIVQARPGDLRNWTFIREWATGLGSAWASPAPA